MSTHSSANSAGLGHVLITGAKGGIGRALVDIATANGHRVTAWDLPEVDICNPDEVRRNLDAATARHGAIDILIHAAGVMQPDRALDDNPNPLDNPNFTVNLGGAITVASMVAQEMCQRKQGAIVIVSSNAATTARVGMASYGASKAAITAWAKTLGLECAKYGVRCNVVSPGSTRTPMLEGMWPPGTDQSAQVIAGNQADFRLGIPLGKLATPGDVAQACWFLASPAAGHITMHDLRIDGGATLDS